MSVINQMLQDLDKRNEPAASGPAPGDAIRSVKTAKSWRENKSLAAAIVALGMVMLALGVWLQWRNKAAHIVVPAPLPAAVAAQPPVVATASVPQVPAQVAAPASSLAAPSVVAVAPAASAAPLAASPSRVATAASATTVAPPIRVAAAAPALKPLAPTPELMPAGTAVAADKPDAPVAPKATPLASRPASKSYSPRQVAGNLLSEAVVLDQQGHLEDAKVPLRRALEMNPLDAEARQMLVQLLFETGHNEDARLLLSEGHRLLPAHSGFATGLARLQLESGDTAGALKVLQDGLPSAGDDPQYHAFLAALLLRAQRNDEAVQHYLVALRSDPSNPNWLVGVGVAFEAVGKPADAVEAYRRAGGSENLTPAVAKFLDERLAQIGR